MVSAPYKLAYYPHSKHSHRRTNLDLLQYLLSTQVEEAAVLLPSNLFIFTARRYASAVYAVVVCLSVCVSVTRPVLYQNG